MLDQIAAEVLKYGTGGIALALCLYAIKKLVDVILAREELIEAKNAEINALQEKRIEEAMKSVTVLEEASAAIESNASVLKAAAHVLGKIDPDMLRDLERLVVRLEGLRENARGRR